MSNGSGSIRAKLAAGLMTAGLVLVIGISSYISVRRASRAANMVTHTSSVLIEREKLLSSLKDAETGSRGYVVTGDTAFLGPYRGSGDKYAKSLARLRSLTADNPVQQMRIDTLESVGRMSIQLSDQLVRMRAAGDTTTARLFLASTESKGVMEHAEAILGEMERDENALLTERIAEQNASRFVAFLVIVVGTSIAFLLSFLINRGIRSDVIAQEQQQALIQQQARQLKRQARELEKQLEESRALAFQLTQTNDNLQAANVATGEARHRAESALLQASEAEREQARLARQNAALLESTTQGVYGLDNEGYCTFINPAGAKLLGYEPTELIGKQIHLTIHYKRPDGSPYPLEECPLHKALLKGEGVMISNEVMWAKDGNPIPVEYSSAPLVEAGELRGSVVAFTDISERLAAERALRENEARKDAVLRSTLDAIVAIDAAGNITEFNRAGEATFGYKRADVLGKPLHEMIIPERYRAAHLNGLNRFLETGQTRVIGQRLELPAMRKDGSEFLAELSITQSDIGGSVSFTGVVRDITEWKKGEVEREQLIKALGKSNEELDQFAYVASHDLKAPLRGIANLSQWIEEDLGASLGGEGKSHMALLRGRVNRMEALIDGILQYSRAGRMRTKPETVDVGELVKDVIELISPPQNVDIAVMPGIPTIETERVPLQQIFINLIGNAVKHAGADNPRIAVTWQEMQNGFLEFAVTDNGQGIAPQYHDRIFAIFQTLEARDRVEGTGIGLSVVKKIVESHGGQVWVESDVGKGSTFRFLWPRVPKNGDGK
ncbi:MAG TPA: PAS domain S-box protein [Gemmatimonadaceae bacterium]|nr:PAS domain S-box protein [Gemmatimonadaceae bacterium]